MPCYPALALLLGSAMADCGAWVRRGSRVLFVVTACAGVACVAIFLHVRQLPTPGDISMALAPHPGAYTLSLGHMQDLTLESFAYLRFPLVLASIAFLVGALGNLRWTGQRAFLGAALMMVLFLQAARIAMVRFDSYLSSKPLADAIRNGPDGGLITQGHYYPFSSIFFYLNRDGLLLNGRRLNLEYGAAAPGAPDVFIDKQQLHERWLTSERYYLALKGDQIPAFEELMGGERLNVVADSGGKLVLTNQPYPGTRPLSLYKTAQCQSCKTVRVGE